MFGLCVLKTFLYLGTQTRKAILSFYFFSFLLPRFSTFSAFSVRNSSIKSINIKPSWLHQQQVKLSRLCGTSSQCAIVFACQASQKYLLLVCSRLLQVYLHWKLLPEKHYNFQLSNFLPWWLFFGGWHTCSLSPKDEQWIEIKILRAIFLWWN